MRTHTLYTLVLVKLALTVVDLFVAAADSDASLSLPLFVFANLHTCTYAHTHTQTHADMHACRHADIHTYVHMYMYTYTHTYVTVLCRAAYLPWHLREPVQRTCCDCRRRV